MEPLTLAAIIGFSLSALLGIIAVLIALSRAKKLKAYTVRTTAEIVKLEIGYLSSRPTDKPKQPLIFPTYRYKVNGVTYEKLSRVGTTETPFKVGDLTEILCDPDAPEKMILVDSRGFKIAVTVLGAMAVFFAAATLSAVLLLSNI